MTLAIFNFESAQVRTLGTAETPLFVAIDIAVALGYKNPKVAASQHVDPEDITSQEILDSMGRKQTVNCVNESGLYALIFGSKLESAKRFKRWITSEVLPALRKTGSYSLNQQPVVIDPAVMVQKALEGEIDAKEASATLAGAAVLLQITDTLKKTSSDTKIETLLQASKAFEQVLSGQSAEAALLSRGTEAKNLPEKELSAEEQQKKLRRVEKARHAAQVRWERVREGGGE